MVLRCPKCTSKYKVRDDIVTSEGVKAKCYKCGSIFFVRKREAVELNNIVSSLKENISKWEERAVKGIGAEVGYNGADVKEERDEVDELLNEIESDILERKDLPREERLKDSLNEDIPAPEEKSIEEELSAFTEDIIPPIAAESKKDESAEIDEFLNEFEEKKAEPSIPESAVPESPLSVSPEIASAATEAEKQAEANLDKDMPVFSDKEFIPLDTGIKGGGILSQEVSGSLEPPPADETAIEKALTDGIELMAGPTDTVSGQAGDGGEVDLDKLLEDTAVEMGIGDEQKGSAASEVAIAEPPAPSEFDELMKKASESLDATMVSSENLETEVRPPVSDITAEDTSPIDVMADMDEEFKPKETGFFGKIMDRLNISSYLSRLGGRFSKKPPPQDIDLTEGSFEVLAEVQPSKRKITWKLIILSIIMLAVLAAITGVIAVVAKKWMSGIKEKEEIIAVKDRPSPKPRLEEKKIEEPVKPLKTEKPPEIEKKPVVSEANLPELQQPPQAEVPAAPPPPAPVVPKERLARLGIILPIAFSSEETKVMTMNVKLELENKEAADRIKEDPLYYEGILEDLVDQFFRDKFYEDTHFVREKLKEVIIRHLNEKMKNGRIKKVDIEELKVK